MKRDSALGFIETVGLASSIVAADAALKSANVELIGREISKGQGWVTIKIAGDVAAVQAAVSAAKTALAATAATNTAVAYTDVIPRPADGLSNVMVRNKETVFKQDKKEKQDKIEDASSFPTIEEVNPVKETKLNLIEETNALEESTPLEEKTDEVDSTPEEEPVVTEGMESAVLDSSSIDDSPAKESSNDVKSVPQQEPAPHRNAGNKYGKRKK